MTQIKLRRDTSANFTSKNPVLGVGEPAYETDTKKLKIGDGTTAYTQLEYFSAGGGGSTNITATLPLKIVDGVISLEIDGQTIQIVDGKLHASNNIFDISKFKVVGNPTITDDGIASWFSDSNYVTSNVPFTMNDSTKKYVYKGKITIGNDITTDYQAIFNIGGGTDFFFVLRRNTLVCLNDGGRTCSGTFIVNANTTYDFILEYKIGIGGQLFVKELSATSYTDAGLEPQPSWTGTTSTNIFFGKGSYQQSFNGSIDLKQFSITVDGKEVFNGLMESTKPIYDAIKANNTELSEFKTETSNDFSVVDSALNEKANLSDLALKQNKLTAGDNITISADNVISAAGGSAPSNMVTTDTAQTITGSKTFENTITLRESGSGQVNHLQVPLHINSETSTLTPIVQSYTDIDTMKSELRFGNESVPLHIKASRLTTGTNKTILTQGNVVAGDNIVVTETDSGVQISSTGGDGDWTYKHLSCATGVSIPINTEGAGGVFTYDLSNYLPTDDYKYEVTISVEVTNSSFCTLGYYLPDNSWYAFAKGGNPTGGCFTAIVDSSRQVKISVVNTQEALFWVNAAAYRRLGKKV